MILSFISSRPRIESALLQLDKSWAHLPKLSLAAFYPNFEEAEVTLTDLPMGPWSSPIADLVVLAKLARCEKPRTVLEVGSYRGHATKLLAAHSPADARIVAFDRDPRHGEAYRESPLAAKITRRVGEMSAEAFHADAPGSYDFIFLDADHSYDAVRRDTEILLPLLSPSGLFVWHDYGNWGRLSGLNGVPRYLHELAQTRRLACIEGSWLAVHSPAWGEGEAAARFQRATTVDASRVSQDVWNAKALRG